LVILLTGIQRKHCSKS